MKKLILKFVVTIILFLVNNNVFAQIDTTEDVAPIRTRNIYYGNIQNAQGLKKGEGIVRINGLFSPQIRYGVTDDFSVGFSTHFGMLISTIRHSNTTYSFSPLNFNVEYKKSIQPNLHIALGANINGAILWYDDETSLHNSSRTYLATTIGNHKNNLTLQGGCNVHLLMNELESIDDGLWFGSIATKIRMGKYIDFIGELNVDTYHRYVMSWSPNDNHENEISYGGNLAFRFYVNEKWSFDVGVNEISVLISAFGGIPIPYVSAAIPIFNTKN